VSRRRYELPEMCAHLLDEWRGSMTHYPTARFVLKQLYTNRFIAEFKCVQLLYITEVRRRVKMSCSG